MVNRVSILLVVLLLAGSVFAEEATSNPYSYKALGAAVVYSTSPYIDDDSRVIPIPMIVYMTEQFYFSGLEAGYALAGDRQEGIGLYATLSGRMDYYEEKDSYIFDGMGNRYRSIDGGIKLKVTKDVIGYEVGAKYDILANSHGYEIFGNISKSYKDIFECEDLDLSVSAGVSWRSDNLNDYYYGVEPRFATALRNEYRADGGFNYDIGMRLSYQLDEQWSVFNTINAEFLSDDISDSPLVDEDVVYSVMLGLIYKM